MSVEQIAATVLEGCRIKGLKLSTAESCTGGLIASTLTEIAGASDVFEYGFVTYSNRAKSDILGVSEKLLDAYGAVSPEVAVSMAEGAAARACADLAVSVTGIAGPGGGSEIKPVGLVHMAIVWKGQETLRFQDVFEGNRMQVRAITVHHALTRLESSISADIG